MSINANDLEAHLVGIGFALLVPASIIVGIGGGAAETYGGWWIALALGPIVCGIIYICVGFWWVGRYRKTRGPKKI